MPNMATLEGATGPGMKLRLEAVEVNEVKFNFNHNTIEITLKDGTLSTYDLALIGAINTTNEKGQFLIELKSKEKEDGGKHTGEVRNTPDAGPVQVDKPSTPQPAGVPPKSDFPPKPS